jgi:hypothetical protein
MGGDAHPGEASVAGVSTVVIEPHFHGPPDSANGGYTCGLVAAAIDGAAQVTLRVPPPLGTPLELQRRDGGAVLLDGETVVAEGRPAVLDLDIPRPVGLEEAQAAAQRYPWRDDHPYPTCYVCGPDRDDGLSIYPGPVEGRELFAAPWTPEDDAPERTWAAIDCPSGIVCDLLGEHGRLLLGRLTGELHAPVVPGAPHVVVAWPLERDGRKLHTASALFGPEGELYAAAQAVWIEVTQG